MTAIRMYVIVAHGNTCVNDDVSGLHSSEICGHVVLAFIDKTYNPISLHKTGSCHYASANDSSQHI